MRIATEIGSTEPTKLTASGDVNRLSPVLLPLPFQHTARSVTVYVRGLCSL